MKDEAKIKSKHKRKFLLKFLLQQKLDQTNRTIVSHMYYNLQLVLFVIINCNSSKDHTFIT